MRQNRVRMASWISDDRNGKWKITGVDEQAAKGETKHHAVGHEEDNQPAQQPAHHVGNWSAIWLAFMRTR